MMLLATGLVAAVHAHESIGSVSNAVVTIDEASIDYYLRIPRQLRPFMFATTELRYYKDYFSRALLLGSAGQPCRLEAISPFSALSSGNEIVRLSYRCAAPVRELTISSEALLDVDDKHVQVVKVFAAADLDQVLGEAVLDARHTRAQLHIGNDAPSLLAARLWRFFELGVEHILIGLDHILFIITVILATTGWRDTLKLVSAFTVAHSITLALAFFGLIALPATLVEPLIALSILYVAVENVLAKRVRARVLLVFAFGLVHGLGFVNVLRELSFEKNELLSSLLAFNLGIEAGQLLIVLPFVLLLDRLRRHAWQPSAIKYASLATGLAGLVWLLERLPYKPLAGLFDRLA